MKHVVASVVSRFAAVAIVAYAGYAHAELLVYESFEQAAPGALNAQNGSGDGFAGAYVDNGSCSVVVEQENRMVYQNGDISIDGGTTHMRMQVKKSAEGIAWGRSIDELTATEDDAPFYMSFLLRVSDSCANAGDIDSFLFGITTQTGQNPLFGLDFEESSTAGSGNALGLRANQSNNKGSTPVVAGDTCLVVYKWYKTSGYYRGISMAVNPSSAAEPEQWDFNMDSRLNKLLSEYRAISCYIRKSCETEDQFEIDEFRIGRSWADVTGPATYNGLAPRPAIDIEYAGTSYTVTITQGKPGVSCYYTTDGTIPSASNGTLYTEPFVLTDSADVRAVAVDSLGNSSIVVLKTANFEAHWTGEGEDDDWTTPANWLPNGTPANKALVFGAQDRTLWGTVNNVIGQDVTVRSLCFTNNNFAPACETANYDSHVAEISPGARLKVVGMDEDGYSLLQTSPKGKWGKKSTVRASFTGGGAFEVASPDSTVLMYCNSSSDRTTTTLDLSGLGEVKMDVSRIYVGLYSRMIAKLLLATAGRNELTADALLVGDGHGVMDASADASELRLGQRNAINADLIAVGSSEDGFANANSGKIYFADGLSSPSLEIRSRDGLGRAEVRLGGHGWGEAVGMKSHTATGTFDFSPGTVDALIDGFHIARSCGRRYDGSNNGGATKGVVKMSAGVMDVNNLYFVYSVYHNKSSDPSCLLATGEIDVSGGDFIVNGDADAANNRERACQGVTAKIALSGGTFRVGGDLLLASRHGYATNVVAEVDVSGGELTVGRSLVGGTDDKGYTGNYTAEKVNVAANVTAAGGVIAVTNEQGTAELRIESGTLALQGGKVYADSLVMTNEASEVEVVLSGDGFVTAAVGKVRLGGRIKVSVADGFDPHGASVWDVVSGMQPRDGTFDEVDVPEGYRIVYTPTGFSVANKRGLAILVR